MDEAEAYKLNLLQTIHPFATAKTIILPIYW